MVPVPLTRALLGGIALLLAFVPPSAAAPPPDGTYYATTSQGLLVSLDVEAGGITAYSAGYDCPSGSFADAAVLLNPCPISSKGHFECFAALPPACTTQLRDRIAGDFSGTGVAGTFSVRKPGGSCCSLDLPFSGALSKGEVSFTEDFYEAEESNGTVLLTVERAGTSHGDVTVHYATADETAKAGKEYQATSGTLHWADGDAAPKTIAVRLLDNTLREGFSTFHVVLSDPTPGVGLVFPSSADIQVEDNETSPGSCVPDGQTLCIDGAPGDRRFQVRLSFTTGGATSDAHAVPLASLGVSSGGLFWFFSATNPEVLVKVLDGCGVNDRFWVFLTAGTDVGLRATVVDEQTGNTRIYVNPVHTAALPVQDTGALPCTP